MAHGKHRKENNNHTTAALITTGALSLGGLALSSGTAHAAPESAWDKIAECESNGRWDLPYGDRDSTGGLQFRIASWNDALAQLRKDGIDTSNFKAMPYQNTKNQQILAGEALLKLQGPSAWTCNGLTGGPLNGYSGGDYAPYLPDAPKPDPVPAAPKPDPKPDAPSLLDELKVEPETDAPGYDRSKFGEADRAAVLKRDTRNGKFYSRWDDKSYTDASEVDVDHTVALKEAWQSGADSWSADKREEFGTDLDNLHVLTDNLNSSKGDRDAAEWLPTHDLRHFAEDVVRTKHKHGLSVDEAERDALARILDGAPVKPDPKNGDTEPKAPAKGDDCVHETHTVEPGDTLYGITKAHTGDASDDNWKGLYAANKGVVGGDPDLIFPGQVLDLPWSGGEAQPAPAQPAPAKPAPKPEAPKADPVGQFHAPLDAAHMSRLGDGMFTGPGGSYSRSAGGHSGADWSAPAGANVYSVAAGTVHSGNAGSAGYGNHVIVDHGGVYTLYAHLSSISVIPGQKLNPGDKVGTVGSTGNSSGPHLHFEVRTHPTLFSGFLDPVAWLKAKGIL